MQIDKLESIGVIWDSYNDLIWERYFEKAKGYYEQNGDLNIPKGYIVDGLNLGVWLQRMRQAYANKRFTVVTPEKKRMLDSIGMVWSPLSEQWEKNFLEAMQYYNEHGSLYMDNRYISPSGLKLGYWIAHLRQKKDELTEEQISRLDKIGMVWDTEQYKFDNGYIYAQRYYRKNGRLDPPVAYVTEDGFKLGLWLEQKRRQYKKGTLSDEYVRKLEALGILWRPTKDLWQQMFEEAKKYHDGSSDLLVPKDYLTSNGKKLEAWLVKQRRDRAEGKLSEDKVHQLDSIGMVWDISEHKWNMNYEALKKYFTLNDTTDLPYDHVDENGLQLYEWLKRQKRQYIKGDLSVDKIIKLRAIGIKLERRRKPDRCDPPEMKRRSIE